jgi:hypothetical protein
MDVNPAAQQRLNVTRELWTSFAALVRSYAAALTMAAPEATQIADDSRLTIANGDKVLALTFDDASSTGQWTLSQKNVTADTQNGSFRIAEDGRVSLNENSPKEMDEAAEVLTAKIM